MSAFGGKADITQTFGCLLERICPYNDSYNSDQIASLSSLVARKATFLLALI